MTQSIDIPMESVKSIAREAAQAILAVYDTEFAVEHKDDRSPLTQADMASHHCIVEGLGRLTPGLPILSEESSSVEYDQRRHWNRFWLVDPLDGTREFIKRNGEFTVNIALVDGQRPILGVVHVPVTGVCYYGSVAGAFIERPDQPPTPIHVTPAHHTPLRVAGSRSHAGDSLKRFLENVGEHEIVSMGSSLKLCLVAEGKADIYPRLGPTSEWDTAAAQAVVEAAGGRVTDAQMQPLRYNKGTSLLNPHFLVFGDSSVDWSRFLE
jgi:3'(2'), 5'-bisphosphate nucleotidase